MRRILTSRIAIVLATVVVVALAACSGSNDDDASSDSGGDRSDAGADEVASADDASDGADGGGEQVTDFEVELAGAEIDRKIVYRGDLTSEVDDVASAARSARDEVAAEGGFVFGQEISGDTARVVLKVPSVRFDAAFDAVTKIGTVESQSIEADDVTAQFTDLESRRATLEASIVRLRGFLDDAPNADEVSRLESELTAREAERDVIAGQLRVLGDSTSFGTISATFRTVDEKLAPVEDTDESGPPGFGRGLEVGVDGVVVLAGVAATVAGFALPYLPLLLVGLGVIVWRRRRVRPSPA
jgi:hypothetical protein